MTETWLSSNRGLRNYTHSLLLLAGMLALLSLIGWIIAGPTGIWWFLFVGAFILITAPRIPTHLILRLHGARALQSQQAERLHEIVYWLVDRAGMKYTPTLYYIPTAAMSAFSTGLKNDNAIAISDGMLRQLNSRELTGVLAHEISHIHNKDILVMLVADIISRLTNTLAIVGYFLLVLYIPMFIVTDADIPWLLLIIMMSAPTLSALMQLALSRSREFHADAEAAALTGDPMGLASALEKINYQQGDWIEMVFTSGRRLPEPSLLRTHPALKDRVDRLRQIESQMHSSAHPFDSTQKHDWTGFPPAVNKPGRRFPGLFF